jgi:hypothetical protein
VFLRENTDSLHREDLAPLKLLNIIACGDFRQLDLTRGGRDLGRDRHSVLTKRWPTPLTIFDRPWNDFTTNGHSFSQRSREITHGKYQCSLIQNKINKNSYLQIQSASRNTSNRGR